MSHSSPDAPARVKPELIAALGSLIAVDILIEEAMKAVQRVQEKHSYSPLGVRTGATKASTKKR